MQNKQYHPTIRNIFLLDFNAFHRVAYLVKHSKANDLVAR